MTPGGRSVITNEEFSDTIVRISLTRRPRVVWEYGHQGAQGSAKGYLAHPDDAYLLPNGLTSVADIINCRVLWLNRAQADRAHDRIERRVRARSTTRARFSRTATRPLSDGGVLVTEIGGWVDRFDRHGHLKWSIKHADELPLRCPAAPERRRARGRLQYARSASTSSARRGGSSGATIPASGPRALDRPSLAVMLPNGTIAVTDDWNHRVVLIDRRTRRIVWSVRASRRARLRARLPEQARRPRPDPLTTITSIRTSRSRSSCSSCCRRGKANRAQAT